jgi:hypothetical protein
MAAANAQHTPGPQAANWQLPPQLLSVVESQAALEGVAAEVIATRLLQAGLNDLGLQPQGRCSLRIGLCGAGPVPLPLQQNRG